MGLMGENAGCVLLGRWVQSFSGQSAMHREKKQIKVIKHHLNTLKDALQD
jgi:hypothetical protein